MKVILVSIYFCFSSILSAQNVYKTPSGEKYHLASCRMVENVSKKLVTSQDIKTYNLDPCKICKPPLPARLSGGNSLTNKAVGEAAESVRCRGITQEGSRCRHTTKLANGYCYQHTGQHSALHSGTSGTAVSSTCGAPTQSGTYCKRKVSGGGYCYQHR
ncbi:MAG TPA: DUF5763 domain-containing protein [Saprospiraceae bacterium]|nr:DUF5763 domain-containing protein [Saprospiraceae bacterium]HQW54741.1 DUF5763 domain-containing protein [Saprospiraceae bacterium]